MTLGELGDALAGLEVRRFQVRLLSSGADIVKKVGVLAHFAHTGTTSCRTRSPMRGLSESRSTRSTFTPSKSLR